MRLSGKITFLIDAPSDEVFPADAYQQAVGQEMYQPTQSGRIKRGLLDSTRVDSDRRSAALHFHTEGTWHDSRTRTLPDVFLADGTPLRPRP